MKIKIKKDKILLFTSQLNSLIKAGINITQALEILLLSETNPIFYEILKKLKNNLDNGKSIFNSFKPFENIFGNHFLYMLRVGELSGALTNSLENIHSYLEYNLTNKRKIISLLIYPTIVFTISLIILIFLLLFILPNFISLFEENQIDIPTITKILIYFSNNFLYIFILFLIFLLCLISITKYINSQNHLKLRKDSYILNIFIFGNLIKLYYADEIYYSLHILLNSGVGLVDGINIISENIYNLQIKKNLLNAQRAIKAGHSISVSLRYLNLFNERFHSFIKSGEESGFLSDAFFEISKILKLEYEYKLKKYIAFIEPFSIIFLGFFILLIILAIYLPIFSMMNIF